jgi:hypothetical protein
LEYLIIIAAVLAVAAVVVLVISRAGGGQATSATIANCQSAASDCAKNIELWGADGSAATCITVCEKACKDPSGTALNDIAECEAGNPGGVKS